jgi:large subunit ribosomal protein L13
MSDKSYYPKASDIEESWYLVDADGQTTGRIASRIASILRGKNDPTFTPGVNNKNYVVVINADKVKLTGNKWRDKKYYRHTEYPGGLKETNARALEDRKPGEVLRKAIHGMLPKNTLGSALQRQLRIFAGPEHTHEAQSPVKVDLSGAGVKVAS